MASPEKEHWLAAIHEELSGMIARHTWDVVRRPKNRAVVGCRWVFTRSQRKDGSIKRYKARLVAKGYSQRPGVDYDETWAPVKRIETLRILMALSVNKRSPTRHYDVTQAFLNGRLQKEIYMEPAPGFEEDHDTVYKLRQSIYGLKQAGRVWHEVLSEFLIGFGFERCSADICAFVLRKNEQTAILLSNVDDLYFLCPDDSVREQFDVAFRARFTVTGGDVIKSSLGIEFRYALDYSWVTMTQLGYCEELLKRHNMAD